MFRRRSMRREMRGRGGRAQPCLHEAQRLRAEGRFVETANIFAQMSEQAMGHGRIQPAGRLALQASRAYAQANRPDNALAQARVGRHVECRQSDEGRARHASGHRLPAWARLQCASRRLGERSDSTFGGGGHDAARDAGVGFALAPANLSAMRRAFTLRQRGMD